MITLLSKRIRRRSLLLAGAIFLLAGCGQKIHGPSKVGYNDHHWWQIWGDKIPASAAYDEQRPEMRTVDGYHNKGPTQLELHLAIPDQILKPEILRDYTEKTGVGFRVSVFESQREFHQLFQNNSLPVDLALVPNRLAEELIRSGRLERLDHSVLTRLKELEWPKPVARFFTRDLPFDPGNTYAVPYLLGSVGIAYNTKILPQGVPSFKALHHPHLLPSEQFDNVKGRIVLLDDAQAVIAAALLSQGENPNASNHATVERAREELSRLLPFLSGYGTTNFAGFDRLGLARRLGSEEIVLAEATSGDATLAMKINPDIDFLIPAEGSILILDSFVIFKGAAERRKKRHAEEFIDYLLDPAVAGVFASFSKYAATSQEAKAFVPRDILNGPAYKLPLQGQNRYLLQSPSPELRDLYLRIFAQLTDSVAGSAN